MSSLSSAQLHFVLGQLDQALYNHEQWYKSLSRALIARLPAEPADLQNDADRHCRFGQWYDSPDSLPLRQNPAFIALGQAHQYMHRLATGLLQRSNDGLPIPPSELDSFNNALDRMRLELQSLRHDLADELQNRDPLTGTRSRASLLSDLREQQALINRNVQTCAIAMLDLDHFKRVNDAHGHLAGDAVLLAVAQCMQQHVRPYDRVYRYGGEEFLLSLPDTDLTTAEGMAQRIRTSIEALPIPLHDAAPIHVTASIGLALLDGKTPIEQSIDHADKALYQAKSAGRNRVVAWTAAG